MSGLGVRHHTAGYFAGVHPRTDSNRDLPQGNIACN